MYFRHLPLIVSASFALLPVGAEPLQFNRDIRPILSENCFACHGFDAKKRKAKLRLDLGEEAVKTNEFGDAAIVPGKPDESLIWIHITSDDPEEVMPPPKSLKKLDSAQKETLRRWIEEGAPYQRHWAFEPPEKTPGAGIDPFIVAALQSKGPALSPEADRPTLIRRVSMALTGLPPTLAEIDAFLADPADGAYERMVDRFLASPHFGEEMARHWLDVARYGDTHGMHLDNERQTWAFRDWVVSAFNRNLPYDQFTIDQLAGDLLPNPSQDQLVATGFNRCNVTTGEGGSINAELLYRYAVDRASTTAQAWLGLTAGCAVCHDHKYDPITTKDFYSLYAFFNSNADPAMDGNALLTKPVTKVKAPGYDAKMQAFTERESAIQERMTAEAATLVYQDPADLDPLPAAREIEQVWFEDAFPAGAQVAASGHPVTFVEEPVASGSKSLKRSGAGMAQDYYQAGAQPLTVPVAPKFFVHIYLDPLDPPEEVMIQFHTDQWKHRALWGDDIIEFGAKGTTERFVAGQLPKPGEWARFEIEGSSMGLTAGMKVVGFAFTVHGGTAYFDKMGVIGRTDPAADPALSFTAWRQAQAGKDTPGAPNDLKAWLKEGPAKERRPEEVQRLRDYFVQQVCSATREHFAALHTELATVQKERADSDAAVPSTFIFNDLPQPRPSFVMIRGQYDTPGEPVVPATPAVLPPLKQAGERANRLDLARWLVAPENPLTARVAVNRFWQQMFGIGLVKSSHDFGTQGSLPSHPELLDWLAVSFREGGWDVKQLVRLMVTSRAFRQQSSAPSESWANDPENRMLSRGPRFRLDAEQIRDQALFVSGLINLDFGGKGVNPYQPPNIWEPLAFGGSNTRYYKQDTGADLYRRTLYTFLKRTAPHPLMENFDMPSRESSCIRRDRTNTPLQALQLMNDVQHFEAARVFAARIMGADPSPAGRVRFAYRSVLSRPPSDEETAIVLEFFDAQLAKYKAAPAEAKKAVTFGESPPPAGLDEPELAAWALVANLILNLDEAIVRN
ncbi:MAG: PSD1 and planctomycete cytochrome C domain-containing protein [Verrucomicrobia bacterium]|nr:PSD1 and planctomycete cytochrome C domain-containing protein [Verrucomicrobiota bacterium]